MNSTAQKSEPMFPPFIMEREFKDAIASCVSVIVVRASDGIIVYATPPAEALFGCQCAKQLDGVCVDTLASGISASEHKATRESHPIGSFPRSMSRGRPVKGKRLDGQEFDVVVGLTPVILQRVHHIVCRFIQQTAE